MNRKAKAILIALVGVLALGTVAAYAGPVVYRDFFAAPAAPAPTMLSADASELQPGGSESVDLAAMSGLWQVVEGSEAGYRVDEVLNGTQVTVTGRTNDVTGSFLVNGLTLDTAEIVVAIDSIETDSPSRDRYFQRYTMRSDQYPTASFTLTEPVTASQAPVQGEIFEQSLTGELTIAGVTRPTTFTAQFKVGSEQTTIIGQIPIRFADFRVEAPNLGFVSVHPEGIIEFELIAELSPKPAS